MRRLLLLATSAISFLGQAIAETVADDYQTAAIPTSRDRPTVEESLRVRLARMEQEKRGWRRADAMRRAAENQSPVHRRNAP